MTAPTFTFDVDSVAAWMKAAPLSTEDRPAMDQVVEAVLVLVDGTATATRLTDPATGLPIPGPEGWAGDTQLAALMLAGRLYRRRNSPLGVEAFGADGLASYVRNTDPDVARLLHLDRPVVG